MSQTKIKKIQRIVALTSIIFGYPVISFAVLSVDHSRLIFNEGEKAVSITVQNQNKHAPYLVQSWLEDVDGKKVSQPFVAIPPIQRIEANSKTSVRVQNISSHNQLPSDRESLFFFNILEIPQRNEKSNSLQLALQTRLKVFYRPEHLKVDRNALTVPGLENLLIKKEKDEYQITNPTPYFITIVSIRDELSGRNIEKFEPFTIAPLQRIMKKWGGRDIGKKLFLSTINDYGARIDIHLSYERSYYSVIKISESDN